MIRSLRILRGLAALAVLAVGAVALVRTGPSPRETATALTHLQDTVNRLGTDGAVSLLGGALIWLVLVWLLLAVGLVLAAELPTPLGALAGTIADIAVPITLRRALAVTLGLGAVTGTLGGVAAAAQVPHAAVATTGVHTAPLTADLDWPTEPPSAANSAPGLPTAISSTRPAAATRTGESDAAPHGITVRSGDSLWSLSARGLGPDASDAQVQAGWHRLYRDNRDVVGTDPSLIEPGQHLRPVDPPD